MRRESLPEENGLLNYWRFEEGLDVASQNDNATHIQDWDATSAQHLRYYTAPDMINYTLDTFPSIFSGSAALIAASPFKASGSNGLITELQFVITNSFVIKAPADFVKKSPCGPFCACWLGRFGR